MWGFVFGKKACGTGAGLVPRLIFDAIWKGYYDRIPFQRIRTKENGTDGDICYETSGNSEKRGVGGTKNQTGTEKECVPQKKYAGCRCFLWP